MTLSTGGKIAAALGVLGALGLTIAIAFSDKLVKGSK